MDNEFVLISQKIATYSHTILYLALLISALVYKRLNPLHKSLIAYILILLVSDWLMDVFKHYSGNTIMVLYIYSFFELAFMLYFFKQHMFLKKQQFITLLGSGGLLYIIAEMLLVFVFKGLVIKDFQPYAKVADNFVIVLMALAYLHERVNGFGESGWGSFRLNMVFLVFFTLNTIIFLPFNFMINAAGNAKFYFWAGHVVLLILFYLYLTFELWANGRRTTPARAVK